MTTTTTPATTPPLTLAELKEAQAAALSAFRAADDAYWAAARRAAINSAWVADDTAYRDDARDARDARDAAWDAAVLRATLEEE